MSGGVAFNPMRKTQPPPPYLDVVNMDPVEYISVESKDGQLFLVHRDCLCVSPLFRRAFAKRANVTLEDVIVNFGEVSQTAEELVPVFPPSSGANPPALGSPSVFCGGADVRSGTNFNPSLNGGPDVLCTDSGREVYTETMRNDATVRIVFPQTSAATLDTVIAYLYYKHRYEGVRVPRPELSLPMASAIEIMKLAKSLEC